MVILTLIISFIVAIVDFLIEGKLTIVSRSYGLIVPVIVLLPHITCNLSTRARLCISKEWLRRFDWYAFFIIAINIPGSIYLHKIGIQYDRFIHFGSAFFAVLVTVLFLLLIQMKIKKKIVKKNSILLISFIILFAGLFLWEGYQYSVDGIFGSKLFYDAMQDIAVDVREDILYGLFGLFAGVIYVSYSFRSFLSSVSSQKN